MVESPEDTVYCAEVWEKKKENIVDRVFNGAGKGKIGSCSVVFDKWNAGK